MGRAVGDVALRSDGRVLLFRVDQINGIALAVLRDVDDKNSLVAILGINSNLFDIMPAELRAHSEVLLELNTGAEVGQFSQKPRGEFSDVVSFTNASARHPIHATVRVERSALQHWNSESYWPTMLIALGLGLAFRPAADTGDREDRRPDCRYRQGSGARRVQAVLPADLRSAHRRRPWLRGAGAMGSRGRQRRSAHELHSARRNQRTHRSR